MSDLASILQLPPDDLEFVVQAVGARWEQLRGQRVLLTGGTGFIGKWLLASFLHANEQRELGAQMVVPSRNPEAFLSQYPQLRSCSDLVIVGGDVRELSVEAVGTCRYALHAATDVVAASSPGDIFDTCLRGTQRVLDVLAAAGGRTRMLLLSSGAVYGRTPAGLESIPEDWHGAPDPLDPASAYGEGKRASELLCALAAAAQPGLEVAVARCFAFVGPHLPLRKHFAIGNFIDAAMSGQDIQIQGDGTPLRSYLYTADLAHWLWVMLFDAPAGRAFNVGGAEALSIGQLAHRVNQVLGGAGTVKIARPATAGAVPQKYLPSIERSAAELGLSPSVGLDEAILRTARWAALYCRD